MAGPRIAPGGRAELGPLNWLIVSAIGRATGGRPPNVFTTLGRHRRLFRGWLRFASTLMPRGRLPRADSELVILRVAHNCGSEYEWRQHEQIARTTKLDPALIEQVRGGPGEAGFSPRQASLLRAADELHADRRLSDETWGALQLELSELELIELCMLIGHYEMLAMTLNALQVEPDEQAASLSRGLGARIARSARGRTA